MHYSILPKKYSTFFRVCQVFFRIIFHLPVTLAPEGASAGNVDRGLLFFRTVFSAKKEYP